MDCPLTSHYLPAFHCKNGSIVYSQMFKLTHGYLNICSLKWFYPIMFDDVVFETEAFLWYRR